MNYKRRTNWGASIFDYPGLLRPNRTSSIRVIATRPSGLTGGNFFVEYPFNRHYRVQGGVGDSSTVHRISWHPEQRSRVFDQFAGLFVETVKQTFLTFDLSFVGDTTRYQAWGPFQGKRFNIGVLYAPSHRGRHRRRRPAVQPGFPSLQAAHPSIDTGVATIQHLRRRRRGRRERLLSGRFEPAARLRLPGVLRHPDRVEQPRAALSADRRVHATPLMGLRGIRGLLVPRRRRGVVHQATRWYDPDLRTFRIDPQTGEPIPFSRSGIPRTTASRTRRASYGMGLSFFFLGRAAVQLRVGEPAALHAVHPRPLDLPGSSACLVSRGLTRACRPSSNHLRLVAAATRLRRMGGQSEFYIAFDW